MKNKIFISSLLLIIIMAAFISQTFSSNSQLPIQKITIINNIKQKIVLTVELATTLEQRERGLMFRKAMPSDHGMLFDFTTMQHVSMWMKNTIIPLDMLFIDDKGIITQIVKNTIPDSTKVISSNGPIRFVLELNSGASVNYHLTEGCKLI